MKLAKTFVFETKFGYLDQTAASRSEALRKHFILPTYIN
jgi:hypothetical protein